MLVGCSSQYSSGIATILWYPYLGSRTTNTKLKSEPLHQHTYIRYNSLTGSMICCGVDTRCIGHIISATRDSRGETDEMCPVWNKASSMTSSDTTRMLPLVIRLQRGYFRALRHRSHTAGQFVTMAGHNRVRAHQRTSWAHDIRLYLETQTQVHNKKQESDNKASFHS